MGRLTHRLTQALVKTKLTEEQILSAISSAEANASVESHAAAAAPEAQRNRRKYNTREMRADQTEQTVLGSGSGNGNE